MDLDNGLVVVANHRIACDNSCNCNKLRIVWWVVSKAFDSAVKGIVHTRAFIAPTDSVHAHVL